jgi:hypothetical protein
MKWCRQWLVPALVTIAVIVSPAYAQTGTSSITGSVNDESGGVIPGANVVATDASGKKYETVTNTQGQYAIPALTPGTYKVTVTLQGFKTAVVDNVRVVSASPASVNVKLEIGALSEVITVQSQTELVNTQNATVSSTLNADQLNRMPTSSRNALNAVTFLPGVNTTGINRNSTVNGLPESMLNITLDGVSNQDNFLKSTDGFFASVYPRQDSVEQVTVTTAVAGANLGGSGAVTIAFTTRSGTNRYQGSAYEYWRRPSLNTNNWVNERNGLPKNQTKLDQYGSRFGGPIKLPGLYDGTGKAFFFFHYEELRFPNNFTKTRTINNPETFNGDFRYNVGGETRTVNVMQLAAANGQLATFDPQVIRLLGLIDAASKTTGLISPRDAMTQSYVFQSPATLLERQPTGRIDYNITSAHRFSASLSSLWANRNPDYLNNAEARFPGAPNFRVFRSTRPLYSFTLRSTLSSNVVNELRAGLTAVGGAGSRFGQPDDPSQGVSSFGEFGAFVVIPVGTDWFTTASPSWRAAPTYNIDNSLSWLKGKHNFNLGGGYLLSSAWENAQQVVPTINLGFVTSLDPANGMFTQANFPGASNTNLTDARNFYGLLTGRISSIVGQAALDPATNRYVAQGPRRREGNIQVFSAYAQDSWRWTPTLTLSAGLRWDLQTPFVSKNDTLSAVSFDSVCGISGRGAASSPFDKCAFFSRNQTGVHPEFIQLNRSTQGYETDWNNIAPSLSVAWRPNVQNGWMRAILGDPEQATLRGGYSRSYERQGLSTFTGLYGGNPGGTLTLNRNSTTGLLNPGQSAPLLYRDKDQLNTASFPDTITYPFAVQANRGSSLNSFAPDIKIASAHSWTVGFQRSISKDMAVEFRYVGTKGVDQWSTLNYNTRDIERNGFLDEFRLAVANLQANNAAGGARTGSFAFFGPDTGTSPLPIYLAYLVGSTNATNAGSYTGTAWTDTALTGDLIFQNPSPVNSSADLDGNLTRRNQALAAGLPANFFLLNPDVNGNSVTDSGAFSIYHAFQIDLRRRLSRGLQVSANYQYAIERGSAFDGFLYGRTMEDGGGVRHAIKTQWDYSIPVGRGQRYGTNMNTWMDYVLGGWSFKGVGRFQAQAVDFGSVRLVGMTKDDLQAMWHHRRVKDPLINNGLETVFMLPDDVILNTRRAFSFSSTSTSGYGALGAPEGRYIAPAQFPGCITIKAGDCAPRTLILRAPWFARLDIGLSKRVPIHGRTNLEVAIEVLNVMDTINFDAVANPGPGQTIFQTTGIYMDQNNTYDPGGRLGQLMFRFNW